MKFDRSFRGRHFLPQSLVYRKSLKGLAVRYGHRVSSVVDERISLRASDVLDLKQPIDDRRNAHRNRQTIDDLFIPEGLLLLRLSPHLHEFLRSIRPLYECIGLTQSPPGDASFGTQSPGQRRQTARSHSSQPQAGSPMGDSQASISQGASVQHPGRSPEGFFSSHLVDR
jgi:hypothetical protein